ncbi:MAG: SAM-dependent methyltransferase [Sphingobacteriia bacterium 39-39-8]|nr:MAG: SAM-dependent methyltransferase [Sphingobacteriia bacterium 39-39-8]HQR93926.1 class I SAM-dependent methyltransferase [Sediminibacterium sp.]
MEQFDKKAHWDKIYQTKSLNEVSWFQPKPETSLHFFNEFNVDTTASIIDIGGGDSLLVDHLLDLGYQHITVLDISATALERAKIRLGNRASLVKWIVADAATFVSEEQYDFWHDRAAFHFLTSEQEIEHYLHTVQQSIKPSGILVMGTFSEQGPTKCSGIEIKQYSEKSMSVLLTDFFEKIKCITVDHRTPFETIQQFIFCSFRKPQLIV